MTKPRIAYFKLGPLTGENRRCIKTTTAPKNYVHGGHGGHGRQTIPTVTSDIIFPSIADENQSQVA